MTTQSIPLQATTRPASSLHFDWLITFLSLWMVAGIHLDAWAHHQFEVETFFTPWHGLLYSGFMALALVLVGASLRNWRTTRHWQTAVPRGYELSLLGVALFMAGGIGDMLWHILFGIEVDIEALLSPTHLLLAAGGALIVTGPVRAAWHDPEKRGSTLLPALVSLALLLSIFSFFTAYANPFAEVVAAQGMHPPAESEVFMLQGGGIAGILVQTALMMGIILAAVRRWHLPFGSLTLVLTLATLLTLSIHEYFYLLAVAVLGGLAADGLLKGLRPSPTRPTAWRLFAFAVPAIFYALYFTVLQLTGGIWWSVHLWAGVIFLVGMEGWLLSYAFLPPAE